MSDERFRQANDYAVAHGFRAGFPNFHEAAYDDGVVYGNHFLGHGVAGWQDVARNAYNVFRIEDVPAMMRAANDWGAARGAGRAFPTFHQSAGGGGVVYGTVVVNAAAVEFRDVPRVELGVYRIEDVPGMMRAAHDWAVARGYATGLPTFHQADHGAGVVCGVHLFKPGTTTWRDVPADLLRAYSTRNATPWVVVLCHLSDVPRGDRQRWVDFFQEGGADPSPAWRYWSDVSYGLTPSARVTNWYNLGRTTAEHAAIQGTAQRRAVADWARAVAGGPEQFDRHHVVVALNSNSDHGATGGMAVLAYAEGRPFEPGFMCHEMGHALGLDHSFSEQAAPCAQGDARPGAYCDRWDLMSFGNVAGFQDARNRVNAPGLAAPNLVRLGWLHRSRIWRGFPWETTVLRLGALNRTDIPGYMAARVRLSPFHSPFYVEFRHRSGWDRGLPEHAVLLHGVADGLTRLLTSLNGGRLRAGEEAVVPGIIPVVVRVDAIDAAAAVATVRMWPLPSNGDRRVRIVSILFDPAGFEPQGEHVVVRNDRADAVDIGGWVLEDTAGHRHQFRPRVLAPGDTIRLWTGVGQDDAGNAFWGRRAAVWNNEGDTATLRSADGTVVSRFSYGSGG